MIKGVYTREYSHEYYEYLSNDDKRLSENAESRGEAKSDQYEWRHLREEVATPKSRHVQHGARKSGGEGGGGIPTSSSRRSRRLSHGPKPAATASLRRKGEGCFPLR